MAARARGRARRAALIGVAAALLPIADANAAVTAYTSRAAFEAELAMRGGEHAIDFESIAAGTVLAAGTHVGGVGFWLAAASGRELVVTDAWATTSGAHSLGTTPLDALASGDALTLALPPALAVGVTVIAADALPGDFELHFAGAAVAPDADAFFLGLVADDVVAASDAVLVALDPGAGDSFAWNADDVLYAPEADGALAACAALTALAANACHAGGRGRHRS
ncbi:MAG: hypothetical protein DCC71_16460 [Proteobacteria bacterium]|nr:MAG: hypothetical protein DCC71_16460 [Pseudomonadota bacterium]